MMDVMSKESIKKDDEYLVDLVKICVCDNSYSWNKIQNNFIYNRFDLSQSDKEHELLKLTYRNNYEEYIPVYYDNDHAYLGVWRVFLAKDILRQVTQYIFCVRPVKYIHCERILADEESKRKHTFTDTCIILPESIAELDNRLSKKARYNLRREKKKFSECMGEFEVKSYKISEIDQKVMDYLFDVYFLFKKNTHQRDYGLSADEYITKYYVTDIYTLECAGTVFSIVLSCEQTENVYVENLSYNSYYKEFSLGKILYGEFLRILIKKGKKSVSLGQANLDYKKHYGTNIYNVRNMIVYKNSFYKFLYSSLKFINKTKSCVKRFFRQS